MFQGRMRCRSRSVLQANNYTPLPALAAEKWVKAVRFSGRAELAQASLPGDVAKVDAAEKPSAIFALLLQPKALWQVLSRPRHRGS